MIIRSITVKNFGPHEHVHADFDQHSPVIGVLGINGSGKSNILAALRYGLTGQADDTLESYIRDYDPNSKTNLTATVEVRFVKHGVEGVIKRKITKSGATRELVYGTQEPITKAALVDTAIEELLGTDLKAVAVAGFIGQGDLDRLLFGDQADREKLFLRLLGLEELPKRGEVVQNKIRLLLGQLEDLEPLRVADEERVRELQETVTRLSEDVARRADPTGAILNIQQLDRLNGRVDAAEQARVTAVRDHEAALSSGSPQQDVAALDAQLTQLSTAVAALRTQLADRESYTAKLRTIYRLRVDTSAALPDIASARAEQEALQREYMEETELIAQASTTLQQLQNLDALHTRIRQAREQHASAEASYAEARRQEEDASGRVQAASEESHQAQAALPTASESRVQALEAAARELETQTEHEKVCPVCTSACVPTSAQLLARAAEIREGARVAYARLSAAAGAESDAKRVLENARRVVTQAGSAVSVRGETLRELTLLDTGAPAPDAEVLATMAAELAGRSTLQSTRQAQIRARAEHVKSLQQAADAQQLAAGRLVQALADANLPENTTVDTLVELGSVGVSAITELQAQIGKADFDILTCTQQLQAARQFQERLARTQAVLQTQIVHETTERRALDEAMTQYGMDLWRANFPSRDMENTRAYVTELVAVILPELQRRLAELQQLRGELKQAATSLGQVEEALKLTTMRIAAQAHKLQVVRELETLAGALKRGGAPMLCLRRQFDQLTGLANLALGLMDSNFSVHTDPETPASFRFVRLDQSAGVVFGQSKLSGGQRVRLTVAFLLAVQQLILPDLGLLVLDEPSLHLDAPSIEQLRDLIVSTSAQFGAAERQMWVCDHSPILRPAFSDVIEL